MGAEVLHFGGFIDGDEIQDPATPDYVAGNPVQITATGAARSTDDAEFVGIFKNSKSEDDASGPQAADALSGDVSCGIIIGANKVIMSPGVNAAGATVAPFVFPGTGGGGWAVGDELHLDGSGDWDNAAGGAARGRVTKIPASATDTLIAWMYGAA